MTMLKLWKLNLFSKSMLTQINQNTNYVMESLNIFYIKASLANRSRVPSPGSWVLVAPGKTGRVRHFSIGHRVTMTVTYAFSPPITPTQILKDWISFWVHLLDHERMGNLPVWPLRSWSNKCTQNEIQSIYLNS